MDSNKGIASTAEAGQDRGRRWFRTRREGGLAVRGAEISAESSDIRFAEEFGIADALTDYSNGWSKYSTVVNEFLKDETNYAALETVYGQNGGNSDNRTLRRTRDNVLDRDFEEMVTIAVLAGRVYKTHPVVVAESSSIQEQGIIGTIGDLKRRTGTVEAKRKGLFDALNPTPERADLHQRLDDLSDTVARTYKPILKTESHIISDLEGQIRGNTPVAKSLVDNYLQASESGAADDRLFVGFLATQQTITQSDSVLSRATEIVKAAAQKGSIAADFIKEEVDDNDGDNQMRFMADVLKEQGSPVAFANYMAARFESWPSDLTGSYELFRAQYMAKLATGIQRVSGQNTNKLWMHPTMDMLEAAIDRVARRFNIKYRSGIKMVKDGTSVKIGGSSVLTTSDVIPSVLHEEVHEPLKPAMLKMGADGQGLIWGQASSATEISSRLVPNNRKNDRQFIDEVKMIIDRLATQPFGEGTHLLRGQSGRTKFYSINPKHTNLPVKRTKDARVIFTVSDGNLGIFSVYSEHDEYQLAIAGLLKARL